MVDTSKFGIDQSIRELRIRLDRQSTSIFGEIRDRRSFSQVFASSIAQARILTFFSIFVVGGRLQADGLCEILLSTTDAIANKVGIKILQTL